MNKHLVIIAVVFLIFNAVMIFQHLKPRCLDCGRRAKAGNPIVEDPATGIKRCGQCMRIYVLTDLGHFKDYKEGDTIRHDHPVNRDLWRSER